MSTMGPVVALAAIVVAAGCAAAPPSAGGPGVTPADPRASVRPSSEEGLTTPAPSVVPEAWSWEGASPESHPHVLPDEPPVDGEPSDDALGQLGAQDPPEDAETAPSDPPDGIREVDPCSLLSDEEWSEWLDGAVGSSDDTETGIVLEDGEACGWIGDGDSIRLAVGVFRADGEERWIDPAVGASAEPIQDLGDEAFWLPRWPVEESSTMIVLAGDFDLVIEMSAHQASRSILLDGARRFASIMLARLP